jgi:hypothetical protein
MEYIYIYTLTIIIIIIITARSTHKERDIWGTGTISIINEYQSAICEAMVFIILLLCTSSLDPIVCEHLHHS